MPISQIVHNSKGPFYYRHPAIQNPESLMQLSETLGRQLYWQALQPVATVQFFLAYHMLLERARLLLVIASKNLL